MSSGATVSIHGMTASALEQPGNVRELGETLARASAERLGICVAGGGTKLAWGNRPERFDLLLSTRGLVSPCEVDADDLTMTVGAGVTVAEARSQARAKGRVLPLDAGQPQRATVGGVAATGDQGARGAGYGRVRDLALGLKATLADGTEVTFGGRTMKNVAGYDMTKLFMGSFGVLGVITEVTFRLLPRSDAQGLLVVPLPSLEEGETLAAKILDSNLQPLTLEVISPYPVASVGANLFSHSPDVADGPLLLAGFAGHPAALDRFAGDVSGWSGVDGVGLLEGEDAEAAMDALAGFSAAAQPVGAGMAPGESKTACRGDGSCLKARATVPVSEVWALTNVAESLAGSTGLPLEYRIGAARGLLDLWVGPGPDPEEHAESLTAWVTGLRAAAAATGGRLSVTDGLALLPEGFDAWGETGPAVRLMRSLKQHFDPYRMLNAGRFVGGL
ncbi:MAG: FAD-binding oxidoreductase [Thermoleophilia bacterium]|nr:FAD-binding oxidoreductase [Thermoleophilia bacterium]